MRCLFRNAGAMVAMFWSGAAAAAALAGPVNIRTTTVFEAVFDPAAIVQADERAAREVDRLAGLAARVNDPLAEWFPQTLSVEPLAPRVPLAAARPAADARPAAVLIPLPAPAWMTIAGLGCVAFIARALDPAHRPQRALR